MGLEPGTWMTLVNASLFTAGLLRWLIGEACRAVAVIVTLFFLTVLPLGRLVDLLSLAEGVAFSVFRTTKGLGSLRLVRFRTGLLGSFPLSNKDAMRATVVELLVSSLLTNRPPRNTFWVFSGCTLSLLSMVAAADTTLFKQGKRKMNCHRRDVTIASLQIGVALPEEDRKNNYNDILECTAVSTVHVANYYYKYSKLVHSFVREVISILRKCHKYHISINLWVDKFLRILANWEISFFEIHNVRMACQTTKRDKEMAQFIHIFQAIMKLFCQREGNHSEVCCWNKCY